MSYRLETEFKDLISVPNEIDQICKTAVENWRSIFNREIFLDNIKTYQKLIQQEVLSQNEANELNAIFKYFKEVRKAAQYLRTIYLLFDVAHEEPEHFHTFVWQLGQLKDTFKYPLKALPHAAILANVISQSSHWGDFSVRPDTAEQILDFAQQPLLRVRRLIEHSELPAEDFHQLRKKLRLFTNIYTLAVKYGRLGRVKEMKDLLVQLNDELGDINDIMVERAVSGEHRYEENIVTLDPSLQTKIRDLLRGENE